jgi:capsular polysaccharide biosynthesis protein
MNGPTWRIDDDDGSPELTGAQAPLLVTGRALLDALTRTRRTWMAATVIGALLGVAAFFAMPHPASSSTTLLMVHPEASETAMTTDINLLENRRVASLVIEDLGLNESPNAFLSTVTATPVNQDILTVAVGGPDEGSAVERATSLMENFLTYRAERLRSISDGLVNGYKKQLTALESENDALTREYQQLAAQGRDTEGRATEILTARATLGTRISTAQQGIEQATLKTEGAIAATQVVDSPEAIAYGSRRRLVLLAASGAILFGVASIGIILFQALTSDRLRRRREVAGALGVPVRVGVGPVASRGPLSRIGAAVSSRVAGFLRKHPRVAAALRRQPVSQEDRHQRNFEALVLGLESALSPRLRSSTPQHGLNGHRPANRRSGPTTLGLAAIDRTHTAALILRTAGQRIAERGIAVLLVDLTAIGALSATPGLVESPGPPGTPRTYRPEGDPALTLGPRRAGRRLTTHPEELGPLEVAWKEAELVLALVEVDPGFDLDILRTWVSTVVPLVSAGRAGGELLSTIAQLVKEAGIDMPFALLEGADPRDRSLGHPARVEEDREELAMAVQSR